MRPGWRGLVRPVLLAVALTTAFWVVVAAWWYMRFQFREEPRPAAVTAPLAVTKVEPPPKVATAPAFSPVGASGLIVPVAGVRPEQLVDTFTQSRAGGARSHDAIDIPAPRGTPVIAAAAGRVERLFLSKEGGNTIYVRSPDGYRLYYYAHLDAYAAGLAQGQALRQGDAIGSVGTSGNADPGVPHLHFAIWATLPDRAWWEDAVALNPYPLLVREAGASFDPRVRSSRTAVPGG